MRTYIPEQIITLSFTLAAGVLSGSLYDILRVIRRKLRDGKIVTLLTDVLFGVSFAAQLFFTGIYERRRRFPPVYAFCRAFGNDNLFYVVFQSIYGAYVIICGFFRKNNIDTVLSSYICHKNRKKIRKIN